MRARFVANALLALEFAVSSLACPAFALDVPLFALWRSPAAGFRAPAPRGLEGDAPLAAALSGRIAFCGGQYYRDFMPVCVMNADGSGRLQLTDGVSYEYAPDWSPDGRRIAFESYRDGSGQIYVTNADGSQLTRLTHDLLENAHPSWSADGKRIAFQGTNSEGRYQIHVMNADGSGLTCLTDDAVGAYYPDWSPDGKKILFGAEDGVHYSICAISPDGSGRSVLSEALLWDLAWSPDGTRIAGVGYDSDYYQQVYVMNADASGLTRVTDDPALLGDPAWSPDGEWIAYTSCREGEVQDNASIYARRLDGTDEVRLTDIGTWNEDPAWSPLFSIAGQVMDAQGTPLAGVSLRLMPGDRWAYNRVDDGSGGFIDGPYRFADLGPGTYTISAFKAGYVFSPRSHTITLGPSRTGRSFTGTPRPTDGTATYRAVLTGIADYQENPLNWCVEDMLDVTYGLLSGANWSGGNIVQVANAAATRQRIQSAIAAMGAKADGDDVCVVSFSGHGDAVYDPDLSDEPDGSVGTLEAYDGPIRSPEFGHWLNQLGTSHYVVILDCCHSGEHIDGAAVGHFADGLAGVLGLAGDEDKPSDLDDNGSGIVMAGCRANELGAELTTLRNGVFTYCLVEGVLGRKADRDGNGWVSTTEAYAYARPRTIDLARAITSQHPVLYQGSATPEALVGPLDLPDVRVRRAGQTAWLDAGKYRRVPDAEPTLQLTAPQRGTAVFEFSVRNASGTAQDVIVRARIEDGGPSWRARHYDACQGGTDITRSIVSSAGWPAGSLGPGEMRRFRAEVTAVAAPSDTHLLRVSAWFATEKRRTDCLRVATVPEAATAVARLTGLCAASTAAGAEVRFSVSAEATVSATVRNLAGRPVRALCRDLRCRPGARTLLWNLCSDEGLRLPNGAYLIEVTATGTDGARERALASLRIDR